MEYEQATVSLAQLCTMEQRRWATGYATGGGRAVLAASVWHLLASVAGLKTRNAWRRTRWSAMMLALVMVTAMPLTELMEES